MQSALTAKKKVNTQNEKIWLLVCLLLVLVIATAAAAGACLYQFTHRSDCVISLSDGVTPEKSRNLKTAVTAPAEKTIQSTTRKLTASEADSFGFEAETNGTIWGTDTAVELFQTSYKNDAGQITVQSANSDKIIAPGTSGSYTFSLKNTGIQTADYRVWVETEINANIQIPLQTRIYGGGTWLLGDEDHWVNGADLDNISVQNQLSSGNAAEYTIYWQWPFEEDLDGWDTSVGTVTAGQEFSYTVIIHTVASESTADGDEAGNADRTNPIQKVLHSVATGDTTSIYLWLALFLAAAAVLTAVGIAKARRKQTEEAEQKEADTDETEAR